MAGIEREPAEVRIPKSALAAFAVVLSGRAGACRPGFAWGLSSSDT